MRWYLFGLLLLLTGCATPRLYDGEPVDKSEASFISNAYVKAVIRPVGTDESVQAVITDDGIWVSKGSFLVRYACLDVNQDRDSVPGYPHEKVIRIEAGYHYQVNCFDSHGQIADEMHLENIGWQDVQYHTFGEVIYKVPEEVRGIGQMTGTGHGFHFEFYNDWGNEKDVRLDLDSDIADYYQYSGSVLNLALEAYDKGVRTRDAMMKAIAPTSYEAKVSACPKLPEYYANLSAAFKARFDNPIKGEEKIYTDSPNVYHYYLASGTDAIAQLDVLESEDALYKLTQETIDYVKACGTKSPQSADR